MDPEIKAESILHVFSILCAHHVSTCARTRARLCVDLQAKITPLKNALLSDVCVGTSAAPAYLPARYIRTEDADGTTRE